MRITKITTKTGDDGSTGLADGSRLKKYHPLIEAIGAVDELNSVIGLLVVELAAAIAASASRSNTTEKPEEQAKSEFRIKAKTDLIEIQHRLFDAGGELSMPAYKGIDEQVLALIEAEIAAMVAMLPPLTEFILPGGNNLSAYAHLCRTHARRAERRIAAVGDLVDGIHDDLTILLVYFNRLSDYFFALARLLADADSESWQKLIDAKTT